MRGHTLKVLKINARTTTVQVDIFMGCIFRISQMAAVANIFLYFMNGDPTSKILEALENLYGIHAT